MWTFGPGDPTVVCISRDVTQRIQLEVCCRPASDHHLWVIVRPYRRAIALPTQRPAAAPHADVRASSITGAGRQISRPPY